MIERARAPEERRRSRGLLWHSRTRFVQDSETVAARTAAQRARLPVSLRRRLEVLCPRRPGRQEVAHVEAAFRTAVIARLFEQRQGACRIRRSATGEREPSQTEAAGGHLPRAGTLEQIGRRCDIRRTPRSRMRLAQLRTRGQVIARTGSTEEGHRDCRVGVHPHALEMEKPETSTPLHLTTVAGIPIQPRQCGTVRCWCRAILVHHAESQARLRQPALASGSEEPGGTRRIAQHVLATLQPDAEARAGRGVTRVAGVAQQPRLPGSRVAPRHADRDCEQEDESDALRYAPVVL